ncbi:MAG: SPFH domain-containing protein [Bacteroidia bacterium]|nr:SPFH domain-containing protein [Bacteroidia bacterium]MDW8159110.1 SPFH domain-containing protein [Bacteroidia bacterium]
MGLFDFIKGQFIDVIEWVDETRDTLIWKFPDQDREIKMGAQLTVRESQVAIFVNEGKMADVFQPGRYELVTRNMPILTSLKSWKHGFNSPFKVDIYFVSTRQFSNMRWGTRQPIMVSDPEFSLVPLRAFGTFNFRVTDAARFFREFAGTDPHVTTDEILEHFRSKVVTEFSNALKKSGKSLVEINFKAQELGAELLPILQPDFNDIGLQLTQFNVESVSLPEEIQKALTEQDLEARRIRKTMGASNEMELQKMMGQANISQQVQDVDKFLKFQTGLGMEKGGESSGGDMMKTMFQMQMAQQMMQNMNNPSAANASTNNAQTREQILATLKELGELKAAGILTEEEFDAKKKELLSRL